MIKSKVMSKNVKMSEKQQLENVWFQAYDLLSNAGFDILIDENGDNSMTVYHSNYLMVFGKNGMTLKKDTSK
ncbi:MAG: hypothetical protein ACOVOQ_05775 [Flavobacterium sp.]